MFFQYFSQLKYSVITQFLPQFEFDCKMEKSILILLILIPIIYGGRSSSESSEENGPIPLLTKMYCQTEYVIQHHLIELSDYENGFKALAENPENVDCTYVLTQSSTSIYKKLDRDLKKKNYSKKTRKCSVKKLKTAGYDKFRFKINALMGLNIPNEKKIKLHDQFNYEISALTDRSVNECKVVVLQPKPSSSSSSSEEMP